MFFVRLARGILPANLKAIIQWAGDISPVYCIMDKKPL